MRLQPRVEGGQLGADKGEDGPGDPWHQSTAAALGHWPGMTAERLSRCWQRVWRRCESRAAAQQPWPGWAALPFPRAGGGHA